MTTLVAFEVPKEPIDRLIAIYDGFPELQDSLTQDIANTVRTIIQGVSPIGLDYKPKEYTSTGKVKKGTGGAFLRTKRKEGTLKTSWSEVSAMGGGYGFYAGVPYAYVVEYGRYKGVGPRTVQSAGGIYSTQAPEGMVTPLFEGKSVGAGYTMEKVIKQAIARFKKKLTEKAKGR